MQVVKETDLSQIVKIIPWLLEPTTNITNYPMGISARILFATMLILLAVACSKKEHWPAQTMCIFAGKTITQQTQGSESQKNTITTEISRDPQKQLKSARKTEVNERIDGATNELISRTTTITDFTFTFNAYALLSTLVVRKSFVFQGSAKSSYSHTNGVYKDFKMDSEETSEFRYVGPEIRDAAISIVTAIQGDNRPPVTTTEQKVKTYTYSGSRLVSALTTSASGSTLAEFASGLVSMVTEKDSKGDITSTTRYNFRGFPSRYISGNYLMDMTYDDNWNLKTVLGNRDGKKIYLQEYTYDNRPNPENDIPRFFKGIPEPIITVQTTDGSNNLIGDKLTNYESPMTAEYKTDYRFNAAGTPESSTTVPTGGASGMETMTTFRYDCP